MNKSPKFIEHKNRDENLIKKILKKSSIFHLPIVENDEIVDIAFVSDFFGSDIETNGFQKQIDLPVVIMAGGKGTGLDPFTRILPKPLIPIDEIPVIELIMNRYAKFGMKNFFISINYKGQMIKAYFEDHKSDYTFHYVKEERPLGTAGALKLLEDKIKSPFFVSNCDIIIKEDYEKIYDFHKKGGYTLTLVASTRNYTIPYGVCEIEVGGTLKSLREKPQYDFLVNTGMYLLSPEIFQYIPENNLFDMTDLIRVLQKNGFHVGVFPVSEKSWIDVGQWEEYRQTIKAFNILDG